MHFDRNPMMYLPSLLLLLLLLIVVGT